MVIKVVKSAELAEIGICLPVSKKSWLQLVEPRFDPLQVADVALSSHIDLAWSD